MVCEHIARWAVIPVGLLDIAKAAFPVWLGLHLGLCMPVATAAGLAAAVGHNWPIYLRFIGGRGLSCCLGIWLVIFPWGALWMAAFLVIGWRLGDSAPWALASFVTLPLLAHLVGGPEIVAPTVGAMLLLTLVKRLEANRCPCLPRARNDGESFCTACSSTGTSPLTPSGSAGGLTRRARREPSLAYPTCCLLSRTPFLRQCQG